MNYLRLNGQPAVKLHSVNVIEAIDGVPESLRAFVGNRRGNKRAEALFKRLVIEHNKDGGPTFSVEEFSDMLDDGVYDDESGYNLFITHSV